ncbi:unnamed protein product, partial [Plutella xylostella]
MFGQLLDLGRPKVRLLLHGVGHDVAHRGHPRGLVLHQHPQRHRLLDLFSHQLRLRKLYFLYDYCGRGERLELRTVSRVVFWGWRVHHWWFVEGGFRGHRWATVLLGLFEVGLGVRGVRLGVRGVGVRGRRRDLRLHAAGLRARRPVYLLRKQLHDRHEALRVLVMRLHRIPV